jgi:hypothetical protein
LFVHWSVSAVSLDVVGINDFYFAVVVLLVLFFVDLYVALLGCLVVH